MASSLAAISDRLALYASMPPDDNDPDSVQLLLARMEVLARAIAEARIGAGTVTIAEARGDNIELRGVEEEKKIVFGFCLLSIN
jgi:hypothetical protein